MKPALHGKRVRWLGSLDQPHTLNHLKDVGRGLAMLGERDEADGQVWHLPAAEPLTGRQFLELLFEEQLLRRCRAGPRSVRRTAPSFRPAGASN